MLSRLSATDSRFAGLADELGAQNFRDAWWECESQFVVDLCRTSSRSYGRKTFAFSDSEFPLRVHAAAFTCPAGLDLVRERLFGDQGVP